MPLSLITTDSFNIVFILFSVKDFVAEPYIKLSVSLSLILNTSAKTLFRAASCFQPVSVSATGFMKVINPSLLTVITASPIDLSVVATSLFTLIFRLMFIKSHLNGGL